MLQDSLAIGLMKVHWGQAYVVGLQTHVIGVSGHRIDNLQALSKCRSRKIIQKLYPTLPEHASQQQMYTHPLALGFEAALADGFGFADPIDPVLLDAGSAHTTRSCFNRQISRIV